MLSYCSSATELLHQMRLPLQEDYAPGELGFDPLGLCPPDGSQEKYDMQTKELNNGRLVRIVATAPCVKPRQWCQH
jgi:Chlorophyll A-B binding protein